MNITRRSAIGALGGVAVRSQPKRKPNFLFLIADDHAGYVLGADGNKIAQTPNLDRLAAEGTRFAAHHCNSPVCTPSRQSLLTGQMPHMAGVTRLPTPLDAAKPTVAKQFQRAGYKTAVFGKMHFNQPSRAGLHGFDTMMCEDAVQRDWAARSKRAVPDGVKVKPRWQPFKDPARIWLNAAKEPFGAYDEDMKGTHIVRLASQYMEENKDKPFALWVSLMEPHSPYDFPLEDRGAFDPKQFAVPRVGPRDGPQIPLIFRDLSDAEKQGINAAYYTSVRFLDRNMGRVLAKLRDLRLEDDTYVVYMADHGYCLGQHGRFEKHCGYDAALRVPLIMRWPGRVRRGVVRDFTEHIDVPATICDLMDLDALPVQHGGSLRAYLEGRKASPRDHIFSEYLENEEAYIKTDRYKLIYCTGRRERGDGYKTDQPTPGRYVRLYDHANDPGEFSDVAAAQPEVVKKLSAMILERFRRTHPEAGAEPASNPLDWYLRPRDVS